jgi:proteasome lid subunit RPN8/RPN11
VHNPDPPKGTIMVGSYHNHTSKEDFSASVDLNTNDTWPLYLLTPSGKIKKHTFEDDKTFVLKVLNLGS